MKYTSHIQDTFDHQLEILQEIPAKGDVFPTVVLVPGFGVDLHEYGFFDEVNDTLIKNGFATVRFSFEGTGKSSGNFIETTIEKQAQQLKDVISKVVDDRFTDKNRIGILAQSLGTSTVTAALPLSEIKTFVFTATPVDPYTMLTKWFKRQLHELNEDEISEIQRPDKSKTRIGPQFWKSLAKRNMLEDILQLTQPILFIHGGNDDRIRYWDIEAYFNQVVSPQKKLQVVEKSDHAFTGKFRPVALKLIADWFNDVLR